jgi:hypothetical protein
MLGTWTGWRTSDGMAAREAKLQAQDDGNEKAKLQPGEWLKV